MAYYCDCRADRPHQRVHRPLGSLAGALRGGDQRPQRGVTQGVQRQLERVPRGAVVSLRRVFLLASGYTMLRQEHVRIDVLSGRFTKRTQIWIDIIGLACFCPAVRRLRHQARDAAGDQRLRPQRDVVQRRRPHPLAGLRLAAARPALLGMQAVSELIKRFAFLQGLIPTRPKAGTKSPRRNSPSS